MARPVALAITGGIGAGKSEALRAFARHGAATVSSDEIVHHLLRRPDVRDAVVARMGNGIVAPDGEIDRGALATVVFNDRDALAWLEETLHPLVAAEYLRWRDQLAALPDPPAVCVTEVPLLYETGGDARFDKVVVITAPTKLRRARSQVATDDRESRLLDDREKVARADYSYKNVGLVRGARRVRRLRHGRTGPDVRRLIALVVLVAIAAGAAAYVFSTQPPWYERIRYPLRYSEFVRVHAREHGLDPALMAAVIYQESKFRTNAESSSGAIGLMQLTPETAHGIAIRTGGSAFKTSDLYDADINIRYGAWYLHNLFVKYHSERLVLAAYNAGQGNVDRWRARGEPIQFPETRAYVSRVEHLKQIYAEAWRSQLYE